MGRGRQARNRSVAGPAPSISPSDGGIAVDPTFITTPTATPVGQVLGFTGRPRHTLPPTDAVAAEHSTAVADMRGLALLVFALATICLVVASPPEVRRR